MGLHIAILEPYFGGSHAVFVNTLCDHSRHEYTVASMPARKWKWRMRGSGVHFTRQDVAWMSRAPVGGYDVLLCSDMLPVADCRALLPRAQRDTPIVCYFHENQLTYPVVHDDPRDFHFAMTNVVYCLAADAVWFNSHYHRDAFLNAAGEMLARMPYHIPASALDEISKKSSVLFPPVLVKPVRRAAPAGRADQPLTILWSHRWEYDKNPKPFLDALVLLMDEGVPFQVVFLGERFETVPSEFAPALQRLEPRISHVGWLPERADYLATLAGCDLVVSTAIQENFGYAVIESILCGCQPLLPNRLAYPEVIPASHHPAALFPGDDQLVDALRDILTGGRRMTCDEIHALQDKLAKRFGYPALQRIDDALERIALC